MESSSSKPKTTPTPESKTYVEIKYIDGIHSQKGSMPLPRDYRVHSTQYYLQLFRGSSLVADMLSYVAACQNGRIFYGNPFSLKSIRTDGTQEHFPVQLDTNIRRFCTGYSLLNKDKLLACNFKSTIDGLEPILELIDTTSSSTIATSAVIQFSPESYKYEGNHRLAPSFISGRWLDPNLVLAFFENETILLERRGEHLHQLTPVRRIAMEEEQNQLFYSAPEAKNENVWVSSVNSTDFRNLFFAILDEALKKSFPIALLPLIFEYYITDNLRFDPTDTPPLPASLVSNGYSVWRTLRQTSASASSSSSVEHTRALTPS